MSRLFRAMRDSSVARVAAFDECLIILQSKFQNGNGKKGERYEHAAIITRAATI
jgi:hypothetical protein